VLSSERNKAVRDFFIRNFKPAHVFTDISYGFEGGECALHGYCDPIPEVLGGEARQHLRLKWLPCFCHAAELPLQPSGHLCGRPSVHAVQFFK
jgi:hypothetical protein